MHAWIGLGSNLGDRLAHLHRAVETLTRLGRVRASSAVYETVPELSSAAALVPAPGENLYLNAALWLETALEPQGLLEELLETEAQAGRVRVPGQRDAPRPLDLDVLLLGERGDVVLVSDQLTVPHPRLHLRAFAMRPLLDMAPGLVHPALGLPLSALYQLLPAETAPPRLFGWL